MTTDNYTINIRQRGARQAARDVGSLRNSVGGLAAGIGRLALPLLGVGGLLSVFSLGLLSSDRWARNATAGLLAFKTDLDFLGESLVFTTAQFLDGVLAGTGYERGIRDLAVQAREAAGMANDLGMAIGRIFAQAPSSETTQGVLSYVDAVERLQRTVEALAQADGDLSRVADRPGGVSLASRVIEAQVGGQRGRIFARQFEADIEGPGADSYPNPALGTSLDPNRPPGGLANQGFRPQDYQTFQVNITIGEETVSAAVEGITTDINQGRPFNRYINVPLPGGRN